MSRGAVASVVGILTLAGAVHAQIYRCPDGSLYTDQHLCEGAERVRITPNLLPAGPRLPPSPPPQNESPLAILPDTRPPPPPIPIRSILDDRGNGDAEYRARTGPFPP